MTNTMSISLFSKIDISILLLESPSSFVRHVFYSIWHIFGVTSMLDGCVWHLRLCIWYLGLCIFHMCVFGIFGCVYFVDRGWQGGRHVGRYGGWQCGWQGGQYGGLPARRLPSRIWAWKAPRHLVINMIYRYIEYDAQYYKKPTPLALSQQAKVRHAQTLGFNFKLECPIKIIGSLVSSKSKWILSKCY